VLKSEFLKVVDNFYTMLRIHVKKVFLIFLLTSCVSSIV